jgi:hypothetical protein
LLSTFPDGVLKGSISKIMKDDDKAQAEAAAKAAAAAAAAGISVDMIKAKKVITNKMPFECCDDDLSANSKYGINGTILIGSTMQHNEALNSLK